MGNNFLHDTDYILNDTGCWITVGGFSIRIAKTSEGVIADIYPLGKEDQGIIAGTYAYDTELEEYADGLLEDEEV